MSRLSRLPSLLSGETVTVLTPSYDYDEEAGEEVPTWSERTVVNVLVAPGSTSDVDEEARPHGTRSVFTLGFPRAFSAPLRGCRVVVRGTAYAVIGDPQPNEAANCPTAWWYTAEVEAVDG